LRADVPAIHVLSTWLCPYRLFQSGLPARMSFGFRLRIVL